MGRDKEKNTCRPVPNLTEREGYVQILMGGNDGVSSHDDRSVLVTEKWHVLRVKLC